MSKFDASQALIAQSQHRSHSRAAAQAASGASGDSAVVGTPRTVITGGKVAEAEGGQAAKVDWLNATFPGPEDYSPPMFLRVLSKVLRRDVTGNEGRGLFGFERGIKLYTRVGSSAEFAIGFLAYGGESQRGRWMLQLTGQGCSTVPDWHRVSKLLENLGAKITRCDLCVDFLNGEYTVDDAVVMFKAGEFDSNGRPPKSSTAGDWLECREGRTLYVGNAANGKGLRAYEKGKQLGDLTSEWVRYEVQYGNRDRVIPLEILTKRDSFLAGSYPALERMLNAAAQKIDTFQTAGAVTVGHLMFHLKRSYGKLVDLLKCFDEFDYADMVQEVRVVGIPRRLQASAIGCGLNWDQIKSQMQQRCKQ